MALSQYTIWEVETGGSDSLNGGAFDLSQTAGMLTDGVGGTGTSASCTFSSASYSFLAGDVGAWLYIAPTTNWNYGWYKITSVSGGTATVNAAAGQAVNGAGLPTTVNGFATVASPTSGKWTIDYSQQNAAQFAYTDLATTGTGLTVESAAKPFGKQQVGNCLVVITAGTNFNVGRYVIASVTGLGVATVVGPGNISTGAGANGTGGLGGALASPGFVGGNPRQFNNTVFIQSGNYSITSASANISGGCIADALSGGSGVVGRSWEGYNTVRGDLGTAPVLLASGISSATIFAKTTSGGTLVRNITINGVSLSAVIGWSTNQTQGLYQCKVLNCTTGFSTLASLGVTYVRCIATGCGVPWGGAQTYLCFECEAYSNTGTGFGTSSLSGCVFDHCLSYNNTGASTDGFQLNNQCLAINCTAYGNGRHGFTDNSTGPNYAINCIAEANSGFGFSANGTSRPAASLLNCGGYNNTSGNVDTNLTGPILSFVAASSSFFVAAGSANFALNNTATGGALARAAGIPGAFVAAATTGYLDLGAAQHQDSPATYVIAQYNRWRDPDEDVSPLPRRVALFSSPPVPVFVIRRGTLDPEESAWMNSRPPLVYSPVFTTVNNTILRRVLQLAEIEEIIPVPRRPPVVFSPSATIIVRRGQQWYDDENVMAPSRGTQLVFAPITMVEPVPVINHNINQYLYEEG